MEISISVQNVRQTFATNNMSNIHFAHLYKCKQ